MTKTTKEISLTNHQLSNMALSAKVRASFPVFQSYYTRLTASSCCGKAKTVDNGIYVEMKNYVVNLPPDRLAELKKLLRLEENSLFVYSYSENGKLKKGKV